MSGHPLKFRLLGGPAPDDAVPRARDPAGDRNSATPENPPVRPRSGSPRTPKTPQLLRGEGETYLVDPPAPPIFGGWGSLYRPIPRSDTCQRRLLHRPTQPPACGGPAYHGPTSRFRMPAPPTPLVFAAPHTAHELASSLPYLPSKRGSTPPCHDAMQQVPAICGTGGSKPIGERRNCNPF